MMLRFSIIACLTIAFMTQALAQNIYDDAAFKERLLEQKGPYIAIKAGYGLGMPQDELGSPDPVIGLVNFYQSGSTVSVTQSQGTLGGGMAAGLQLGYMFNQNFGIELGFDYFRSSKVVDASIDRDRFKAEQTSVATIFRAIPTLVVQGSFSKLNPYAKMGFVLPVGGNTISEGWVDDDEGRVAMNKGISTQLDTTVSSDITLRAKSLGNPSYGFTGMVGVSYGITKQLSIFAETQFISLTINSKSTSYEEYTEELRISGTLIPRDVNVVDTEVEYVEELTESSNNMDTNPDFILANAPYKDKPYERLSFLSNYNSLSLNLGIKFKF